MDEIKTIYGYPVEDLVLLAEICRREGITKEQLFQDYRFTLARAVEIVREDVYMHALKDIETQVLRKKTKDIPNAEKVKECKVWKEHKMPKIEIKKCTKK